MEKKNITDFLLTRNLTFAFHLVQCLRIFLLMVRFNDICGTLFEVFPSFSEALSYFIL